jgi:drug/metabolite transporter (DMT)-like permease
VTNASIRDPKILIPFILVTLIWSSTWIVIKGQLGIVPPIWSVSYRFIIAGAAILLVARLAGLKQQIGRNGHTLALLLAILQFVLNYNFVYAAELSVTSGLAAVVFALLVIPNAALARAFFAERMSSRFVLGSAIAMAGVALLFLNELRGADAGRSSVMVGLGLTLLAVLSASCANVMQLAPAMRGRPVSAVLGWAMLYGGLVDAVLAYFTSGPAVFDSRPVYWLGLLYLSIVASALAFWLYYRIIRVIGAARAAYSSVLIPIIAMGISTFAEDYRWSALAISGGVLAICGLVLALGSRSRLTPNDAALPEAPELPRR